MKNRKKSQKNIISEDFQKIVLVDLLLVDVLLVDILLVDVLLVDVKKKHHF